ncbi:circularly permuted type 2 ATP-grasp protein [Flavobacterium aquicola]|uniref:Putative circularly permuted ATP-grasp superfamily protein n=1 Tax=Flavobacterium aquicola TaxID=1682742 RepID=A0A3E0EQF0_9FLAO|nr:circularly permuted type 2 ATP-grasp protein [Flavobacterium aquicola]REH00336.1 putative circularly permuted ATP-grasp superfamily protein [Flavobacterium aquicola]
MIQDISLGLLQSYKEKINSYDEVLDQNGEIKPYWKGLFDTLESIGIDELELRNQEIVKKLKENGVTYNVYDSNQESNRAWKLDPIPFLIHESEWKTIEKGLKQRAHLLDLILKDLYGPQTLIKNAIIPAELVFDNAGFLLPCFDIKQKHNKNLLNYAVDLARGPDGKMWLLDNRTQAPSGAGYALENRVVMSKVFPELNKKTYRKKLSPYFSQLQQTVDSLGNNSNENPNVVFLTPGPGNETYFEHVYLSSYLGYTLVQGNDLLVRDGFVWLKSIDQLERVDVIIKRLDDVWCDPLELRRDSLLGIPGLLQVIRLGNISVVNPPGTSILENYGLMAFMQNACKFLLKEPLLISSIATWWCGHTKELDYVLTNLPKLIIKKTNRKQGFRSIYARLLNIEQLEDLKKQIQKNPKEYVAQEEVSLSTTPAFINGTIEPRYAAIRAFLIADGDDYQVMQGGLTRSSAVKDKFEISNQLGGISKDTWIITDTPTEYQEKSVERKNTNNQLNNSLTSRNAENLFWLGRLCERTMALRSFLKIILNRLNENVVKHGNEQPEFLIVLLKSLTHLTQTYPGFVGKEAKDGEVFDNDAIFVNPITELLLLINDSKKVGSVVYNMQSLLNTINQVSEKWNNDTRQIINLLEDIHFTLKKTNNINHVNHSLDKLHIRLFSFYGNIYETLPRDNGFYLMEAGKNVERILSLISVFRTAFNYKKAEEDEAVLMEAILENHHLLAQYRNIYKSHLSLKAVINMVFLEKNLTYTLSFLLNTLTHYLSKLPKTNEPNRLSIAEKSALKASTIINLIDADSLIQVDEKTQFRSKLDQTLSDVFELMCDVSNNLSSLYFNHSVIQHSVLDTLENSESDEI